MESNRTRTRMLERHLKGRGITDQRVIAAFEEIPREAFVSPTHFDEAYEDYPLPIEAGQTISQPYIVALMTQALQLGPADAVLEIGTGSGYSAAILSRIVRHVYTVERHAVLADTARGRLATLGYTNIEVRWGDGTLGWSEHAPYDAIVVAAGGPEPPPTLLEQLAIGGRLVIPVGTSRTQELVRATRMSATEVAYEDLCAVVFVPLIGAEGWVAKGAVQ